jgi:hypothetical protein
MGSPIRCSLQSSIRTEHPLVSAAVALPGSTLPQLTSPNDIVQVGSKGKGKGHGKGHKGHSHSNHHHHGNYHRYYHRNYHKYHYHGRYWGHRYSYRPYNWQTLGCIAAGPIWYCP